MDNYFKDTFVLFLYIINIYVSVFRFFPTVGSYQNHIQLHIQPNSIIQQKLPFAESAISKVAERPKEVKKEEQFYENVKSLTCPTCGKVCNHNYTPI